MYRVFAFSGRSRTTPSNTVPRFGEETETPCAYGMALNAFRGNRVVRNSRVALVCFSLIAETPPSVSPRLSGGVTKPKLLEGLGTISCGTTDGGGGLILKRGGDSGDPCSGGGVGGYWMREEPQEEVSEEEKEDWLGVGEWIIDAGLSVTQSDDPLSGGHF